jgi:hypothetical protein
MIIAFRASLSLLDLGLVKYWESSAWRGVTVANFPFRPGDFLA